MRQIGLAAALMAFCSLGGCATTIRGTTDVLVVESDPPGAHVRVSNGLSGSTPATFRLPRKGDYVVTITKDGHESVTVEVKHKVVGAGSAGMAGNILLGGLIGAAVDAGSGTMFDLVPNPIKVNLLPLTATLALSTSPPRRDYTPEDHRAASATIAEMRKLAQALLRYSRAHGALPEGKTITEIYSVLARSEPVRIADHWGKPFAFGRTPDGFVLASAGADGEFNDATWNQAGDPSDLTTDAVLQVAGDNETFVHKWRE